MLAKINKSKEEQRLDFVKLVEMRGGKYCNKCFDRGYMYYDTTLEYFVPCDCLIKHGMKLEREKLAARRTCEN